MKLLKKDEIKVEPDELAKEGTILVTRRALESDPFMDRFLKMVHMGIVAIEDGKKVVYDLHPDNKNGNGGNLKKTSLIDYLKHRKLIGIQHTNVSSQRIQQVAQRCWQGKYDKRTFNCQKFIDEVTMKQFSSDMYSYYSGIILASVGTVALTTGLLYLVFKKNK